MPAKVGSIQIGGGAELKAYLPATVAWNPASLAHDAQAGTTISVPGAAVGDLVIASFDQITSGNWFTTAYVSAADTVTFAIWNQTGGVVDLGNGTLRVAVFKH